MGYRSYTYEDYQRAMELFNEGLGITTISRMLNITKSTLHYWRHGINKPATIRWIPKASKELAYVLGALIGDGYLRFYRYHYFIELQVRDYDFAQMFSISLSNLLNKKYLKPLWNSAHKMWMVSCPSKAFFTWYKKQNLDTLRQYIEYNIETVRYFLRGLYDAEGSNYKCRQIGLWNTNAYLLKYTQHLLKKYFNIIAKGLYLSNKAGEVKISSNGKVLVKNKNCYKICINRRIHVRRFLDEIGFTITEKQFGLPRNKR